MLKGFESPIFILGAARSGTSLVAGITGLCGAWLGKTVPGGGPENMDGFYENVAIRQGLIKQIMIMHQADPLGVSNIPDMRKLRVIDNLKGILHNAITEEGYKDGPWALKDAKLSLLWPIFLRAFPKAKWVIVRRDTNSIVESCMRTHFMKQHTKDPLFWKVWAETYINRANMLKHKTKHVREIWPDKFIHGDRQSLLDLINWLELDWDEKVENFINKDYWHKAA